MKWFEVVQTRGHIEKGSVRHYQVTLRVGFTLEECTPVPPSDGNLSEVGIANRSILRKAAAALGNPAVLRAEPRGWLNAAARTAAAAVRHDYEE